MTKNSRAWSLVIVICLLSTPIVKAEQIERVTNNNNDGPGSLRQAIIDVSSGGQILFDPQVEGSTIVLTSGALTISKNISIINDVQNRVTLSAQGNSRVLSIHDNVSATIRGLNFDSGYIPPDASDIRSRGGGICSYGRLSLAFCTIINCQAAYGGGIWADSLKMSNCTLTSNKSYKDGGGIYANVLATRYSAVINNEAIGRREKERRGIVFAGGSGGGIFVTTQLDIAQSTISKNKASAKGGGIYLNSTSKNGSMYNCTITENVAIEGGGLHTITLMGLFANNIVANNKGDILSTSDINSAIRWLDDNVIQNNLIGVWEGIDPFVGINNITGTLTEPIDPMLGPLGNNGGATETYFLNECAPSIDKGLRLSNSDTDQRGLLRTVGLTTDIGSVEYQKPESRMCQPQHCDDLVVDAGIDRGVLYSERGFFRQYSCVNLSADVSGGLAPYSYNWSPDIDLSNTTDADVVVCPSQDVTYIVNVVDANGCIATDEVTISAYSFRDARRIQNCGSSVFRVLVCNPNTNTSRCANIYSNSTLSGLGPLLNAGFYPGPCSNIISDEDNLKNQVQYIDKVWPIPSRGEINFKIRKPEKAMLTFRIYDSTNDVVKEDVISPSSKPVGYHHVQVKGLSKGYYAYFTILNNDIVDKGSFFVRD